MKKRLTTFGVFIFLLFPATTFAQQVTTDCFRVVGAGISGINQDYTFNGSYGGSSGYPLYDSADFSYSLFTQTINASNGYRIKGPSGSGSDYYYADSNAGSFIGVTWNTWNAGVDPAPTVVSCNPTPPSPSGGLADEIAAAEQGMASTTGFNISSVLQWSGNNLLKVFIGSGVAIIYGFRYWIVAMLIISLIVLFAFRGIRFFKH